MLLQEPTPELLERWKTVYQEYRPRLSPNRKSAGELVGYLQGSYPLQEVQDEKWKRIVELSVLENDCFAERLPDGVQPDPAVFLIRREERGEKLYRDQDEVFSGIPIVVGIVRVTGYFQVEGSSLLWDELFAFRGLDETDLDNAYLVAEYVACKKRFDGCGI